MEQAVVLTLSLCVRLIRKRRKVEIKLGPPLGPEPSKSDKEQPRV